MLYYPLTVSHLHKTTSDCTIVTLDVTPELSREFAYRSGQYLTLKADIKDEEVRRSYSLCSSPLDGKWQIGVKKMEGGKFSTFINDRLQVGDVLEVAPPEGRFCLGINKDKKRNYVAFAAGSGITPVISIIKTHLTAEPNAAFKLFYVNQTVSSIILKEELEALKNTFMDRLEIFYFLTKEQRNVSLFNGRLDREKMEIIFKTICDQEEIDHYFICGPEAMIFMVRDFLLARGVDKRSIHFELFQTSETGTEVRKKWAKQLKGKVSDITIHEGGKSLNFRIPQGSGNLLDAALKNAADLPFACKGGVCCTCKAKLMEGEVKMILNYGLEEEELNEGYILTCQALPVSEKVVVNFDA